MGKQKYPKSASSTSTGSTSTHKIGRQSYSHAKADARKRRKQDEAAERQLKYESLTLKERLKTCLPGGSKKQRAKLQKQTKELDKNS